MSESMLSSSCCGCSCKTAAHAARGPWGWTLPVLAVALYFFLEPLARGFTRHGLGLDPTQGAGGAVAFFLYDAPKVLMLLAGVTFLVLFVQGFLDPIRVRTFLSRRRGMVGSLLASLFGIVTPFCSCSAVPLFIGFVRAGVPLGVTFSYLVAAPMINEVALVLLWAVFGWKVALLYTGMGVGVSWLAGWLLGRLGMERHLEPWVREGALEASGGTAARGLRARAEEAWAGAKGVVRKAWPYILVGIAVGALIHGYVPEALLARFMGRHAWWSVPVAVGIGVPIYASTAMLLPIVQTLLAKGAALGTVLAFLMAATALSLPETILLRRVLSLRLIAVFLGVVSLGILGVGYVFNLIF